MALALDPFGAAEKEGSPPADNLPDPLTFVPPPAPAPRPAPEVTLLADCQKKLESPGQAGAASWEVLAEWKELYPALRPCPLYRWSWIYRTSCRGCSLNTGSPVKE